MKFLILTALLSAASVAARFEACGYVGSQIRINRLEADPPATVANGQLITMRIRFTVQPNTWIPDGTINIASSMNYVPVQSWSEPLCSRLRCPLYAGEHEYVSETVKFPGGWGHVVTLITVVNGSGDPLLCARWTVHATGTDKNESGSWF